MHVRVASSTESACPTAFESQPRLDRPSATPVHDQDSCVSNLHGDILNRRRSAGRRSPGPSGSRCHRSSVGRASSSRRVRDNRHRWRPSALIWHLSSSNVACAFPDRSSRLLPRAASPPGFVHWPANSRKKRVRSRLIVRHRQLSRPIDLDDRLARVRPRLAVLHSASSPSF